MAFILLWSAISRMTKQLISVWRAVVVVMLLCLMVVVGCDVSPFSDLAGNETSSSSDGTDDDGTDDDGTESTGDVSFTANPSEIDVLVDSTTTVVVTIDNPVPNQTYSLGIEEPPVSGTAELDEGGFDESGTASFTFTKTLSPALWAGNLMLGFQGGAKHPLGQGRG